MGDDATAPLYVETLRGRGVRLMGDVDLASEAHLPARPHVAVLRPAVFVEGERWRTLADALDEELITELAGAPDVGVIARHFSFAIAAAADLPAAAAGMGRQWLVELGLTEGEESLRAHCKLINGETGAVAWTERLDLSPSDLPRFVGDVAARLADASAGWCGGVYATARVAAVRRRRRSERLMRTGAVMGGRHLSRGPRPAAAGFGNRPRHAYGIHP